MDAYTVHAINQILVMVALIVMTATIVWAIVYPIVADRRNDRQIIADAIEREKRRDDRRAARQR